MKWRLPKADPKLDEREQLRAIIRDATQQVVERYGDALRRLAKQ